jgi:hypothetical protein
MREQTELDISAEELRVRVRSLAMPFSGIIEEAADDLEASSPDGAMHVLALRWKTNVIPAMQSAVFETDPLAALLDAWTLIAQMRLFFEEVAEDRVPSEARSAGLAAADRMEREIERLVRSVVQTGGAERARTEVYRWASANPIELSITSRRSAIGDLAALTAEANPGIRTAIGGLTLGMGDVWARLDTYSAWLPKQARWQAELAVSRILSGGEVGSAFEDFSTLSEAIDDIAATVRTTPDLVTGEREAILEALQAERIAALETLNREFLAAVDTILAKRLSNAGSIVERERIATPEARTAERIAVLEAIHRERTATMEDLDRVVGGLAEDAIRRVVDHFFVRALQLLAIVLALAIAVGVIFVLALRKRSAEK